MSHIATEIIQSPLSDHAEQLRKRLLEKLVELQKDYQKAAEPIIRDLVELEKLRPPPRFFIPKEPTP